MDNIGPYLKYRIGFRDFEIICFYFLNLIKIHSRKCEGQETISRGASDKNSKLITTTTTIIIIIITTTTKNNKNTQ